MNGGVNFPNLGEVIFPRGAPARIRRLPAARIDPLAGSLGVAGGGIPGKDARRRFSATRSARWRSRQLASSIWMTTAW
jgi:hypothetical protein